MDGIVDRLMQLDGADGASLSTIDGEHAYFAVCAGRRRALLEGSTLPLDRDARQRVPARRRGDGAARDDRRPRSRRCLTPGAGTIVLAPIEYDGAIRGILGVRSADGRRVRRARGRDAIALLARGAAVALRNAELVERLATSERRYRELHAQAADAMLVCDIDGSLLDANDAAAALLWYSGEELARHARATLSSSDELERASVRLHGAARAARAARRAPIPPQGRRGARGRVLGRLLDDGRVHTSLRDVTQRKRNEERLRVEPRAPARDRADAAGDLRARARPGRGHARRSSSARSASPGADGASVQWFEGDDSVYRHGSGTGRAVRRPAPRPAREPRGRRRADRRDRLLARHARRDPRVDSEACRTRRRALADLRAAVPRRRDRAACSSVMAPSRTPSTSSPSRRRA